MINTQLEHVPLPLKLEAMDDLDLEDESEETDSDMLDDETTLMISSDEEAELEAQRIRFHELIGRNLQLRERGRSTSSSGSSVILMSEKGDKSSNSFGAPSQEVRKRCKKRTSSITSVGSSVTTAASEMESCGNIFIHPKQIRLIFNCSFCDLRYDDMKVFAEHLHGSHKLFATTKTAPEPAQQGKAVRKSAPNTEQGPEEVLVKTELPELAAAGPVHIQDTLDSCGNMFVLNKQKLFLTCGHCECKYATEELFSKHLRQQHQLLEGSVNEITVQPKQEIKSEVVAVDDQPQEPGSSSPRAVPMVAIPEGMPLDNNDLLPTLSVDCSSNSNSLDARTPPQQRVSTETPPPEEDAAELPPVKRSRRKRAEPEDLPKPSSRSRRKAAAQKTQTSPVSTRLRRTSANTQKPKDFNVQPPSSPESASTDRLSTERDSPSQTDAKSAAAAKRAPKKTPQVLHCEQCMKTFTKVTRLNDHKRVHTGEKPYKCFVCGKQFRIKMRLAEHALRHRKEKAFKCEICGHAVATKQDLTLHQRHHNGDKRYRCTQCPKAFVRGSDLKIHVRIHTGEKPFTCEVCQKAFRANQNLIVHRKTHRSEKEFKCEYCDKHFMRNIDRKVHHRTHTGEKPFKCEICNRGYSSRFHVRTHIERDHVPGAPRQRKKPGPKPKHIKEELEKQKQLIEELKIQVIEQIEQQPGEKTRSPLTEEQLQESAAPAAPPVTIERKLERISPEETMQHVSLALKIALEDDDLDEDEVLMLEKENDTPKEVGNGNDGVILRPDKQKSGATSNKDRKITSYFTVVGQKTEI